MDGGERLAAVLAAHRVPFLFALCGGHISPILVACKRRDVRVIDVRHEATAVFAADAVARITGRPGVAAVTAGPGATNTLTALKNAQLAQSPVVLLVGATATVLVGRGSLQDIDQLALLRPHVKSMTRVRRVRDLAPALERALRLAVEGVPGPVAVECPVDTLYAEDVVRGWYGSKSDSGGTLGQRLQRRYLRFHLDRLFAGPQREPRAGAPVSPPEVGASTVERAVRHLRAAERPVLLVGSQAVLEAEAVERVADAVGRLGIPTYLSGMARGLLGPRHPLQRRHRRREALRQADVAVLAGVPNDFRLDYGRHVPRRSVLISANRSRRDLRLNRRPSLGGIGDAGRFLCALAERLGQPPARWSDWREELQRRDEERDRDIAARAEHSGEGVNPLQLCRELEARLDERALLVADGGDFVATASYVLRPRGPLSWLDPGVFGTLGCGAGFALGAKLCHPDREVWLLYGDGAAGYSLSEFDTFVRHGLAVAAVVGNDACWMQIAREQVEMLQDDVGCGLRRTDYHRVAEGFGARGLEVREAGRVEATLAEAARLVREGHPVLVNAWLADTDFRKGSISM